MTKHKHKKCCNDSLSNWQRDIISFFVFTQFPIPFERNAWVISLFSWKCFLNIKIPSWFINIFIHFKNMEVCCLFVFCVFVFILTLKYITMSNCGPLIDIELFWHRKTTDNYLGRTTGTGNDIWKNSYINFFIRHVTLTQVGDSTSTSQARLDGLLLILVR